MQKPHGGKLIKRVKDKKIPEIRDFPRMDVNQETGRDIENIAHGVFSPLEGFLVQEDFLSVLQGGRLTNDLPWTIPILLDSEKKYTGMIALWCGGHPIALMDVEETYTFDKKEAVKSIFGTGDPAHPGVAKMLKMKDFLLGGKIELVGQLPSNFEKYALKPLETRILFREKKWRTIAGFQTRNVPHLGHEWVQKTALSFVDGIFINPIIGRKKEGDFRDEVILETYEVLMHHYYLREHAVLGVLQTEMRYAGPREAIFHAIIRKNFGCTHFIVGRDHAGVGNYYDPYAAQHIFEDFPDLGITPLFFRSFFYCKKCGGVSNEKICPHGEENRTTFSGTKIRDIFLQHRIPPPELMRKEVSEVILKNSNPFV
jgi:sulfate adenylyltransferase